MGSPSIRRGVASRRREAAGPRRADRSGKSLHPWPAGRSSPGIPAPARTSRSAARGPGHPACGQRRVASGPAVTTPGSRRTRVAGAPGTALESHMQHCSLAQDLGSTDCPARRCETRRPCRYLTPPMTISARRLPLYTPVYLGYPSLPWCPIALHRINTARNVDLRGTSGECISNSRDPGRHTACPAHGSPPGERAGAPRRRSTVALWLQDRAGMRPGGSSRPVAIHGGRGLGGRPTRAPGSLSVGTARTRSTNSDSSHARPMETGRRPAFTASPRRYPPRDGAAP
jgi:hypothetical protein